MTTVRFRVLDGSFRPVDGPEGESLMRVAVNNDVPDIVGECGGEMSCATCHVYLPSEVIAKIPPRSRDENELLEVMDSYTEHSRLGCQVFLSPHLEGVDVEVAPDND